LQYAPFGPVKPEEPHDSSQHKRKVTTSQHSPPNNFNDVNRIILWIHKNQTNKNPERHAIIQKQHQQQPCILK
jgi:hypothetical protein